IYYTQGLDSLNGRNFGSNPFLNSSTRNGDYGYDLGSGRKAKCFNGLLQLSYELRENLYFDLSAQQRNFKVDNAQNNTTLVTAGIRLNILKREYDY
ncbi:MAG: hypothetical protein ABIS01_03295, partial [Ferruginibacter sp.]